MILSSQATCIFGLFAPWFNSFLTDTIFLSQSAGHRGVSPPGAQVCLEQQAYMLLTEQERQTMAYYLQEYQQGHITVEPLARALFELFNTHAKVKKFAATPELTVVCGLSIYSYSIFCFHCLPHLQLTMLSEIRSLVATQDLEVYDKLVLHRQMEAHHPWQGGLRVLHPSSHCSHAAPVKHDAGQTTHPGVTFLSRIPDNVKYIFNVIL